MKKGIYIFILLILILLVPNVMSVGICNLDKENYSPGLSSALSCTCTLGTEKNQDGYIVYRNSSHILQSTMINSNDCINSFFGVPYTFLPGQNFSGNVTFSLNADGTGIPSGWDGVTDRNFDNFNVSGASEFECLIEGIRIQDDIILGSPIAMAVEVLDGVTNSPLVNARCTADLYDINRLPIGFEPYGPGDTHRFTSEEGEVGFLGNSDIPQLKIHTTYIGEIHCYCPRNDTNQEKGPCILEDTGEYSGFRSCVATALVPTNGDDIRNQDKHNNWLVISLCLIFMTLGYYLVSFLIKDSKENQRLRLLFFMLAVINTILIGGLIPLLITMNPNFSNSYFVIASTYFVINILISILFIWFKGLDLIVEIFKKNKNDK